ncbi:MAG: FecR domain-containing protein [Alphaproteobacteria bacterium]
MRFIPLFVGLVLSGSVTAVSAAEFIGVAAALRGDVVRVSAVQGDADIGKVTSGTKIFLGDEIEVASGGRMQIMLVDETVFTLGSGARLVIDEFVYDPATQAGSMTTNITKGAFRFVSGKLAKSSPKAMKVNLPSASLSIRGTQVAGLVDEDGGSQVVLVGPGPNNFGATLGAVTVTNDFGSVDLTRPNFATTLVPNQPPQTPVLVTPEAIQAIEASTGEDAETEIAEALGVENLEVVPAIDTDDDGIPDQIVANSDLGASIASATTGASSITNDAEILDAVFTALSTSVSDGEEMDEMGTLGVNLGAGAAALFGEGAQYLGDTTVDELRNGGLTGSAIYAATNVSVACSNSGTAGCGGSYDITDTWNFANGTIRSVMSNGSADLDYSGNGTLDTKISFGMDVTIDYSASGPLGSNIVTMDQGEPMPGYVHVSAEFDPSASMQAYNASLTSSNIGLHDNVNRIDWTSTPGNSFTVTNENGGSLPGHVVFRSDAFLSNFALGSDASATDSLGNIASHELNITKPDGTEIATGTVHGMAAQ